MGSWVMEKERNESWAGNSWLCWVLSFPAADQRKKAAKEEEKRMAQHRYFQEKEEERAGRQEIKKSARSILSSRWVGQVEKLKKH